MLSNNIPRVGRWGGPEPQQNNYFNYYNGQASKEKNQAFGSFSNELQMYLFVCNLQILQKLLFPLRRELESLMLK